MDVPAFQESTLDALLAAFDAGGSAVFRPQHEGRRGHPVCVARTAIPRLLAAPAEASAKEILGEFEGREVDVVDPAILFDVDEPSDYRRLLEAQPGHA